MRRAQIWCGIAALLTIAVCARQSLAQCARGWLPGVPSGDLVPYSLVEWDPDGAGPNPSVLFMTGHVPVAGSSVCRNVAVWDASAWASLGTPPQSKYLLASTMWNGNPVIAVDAEPTGIFPRQTRIYRWTGASWLAIDGVFSGSIVAMTIYRGDLVVAGDFSSVGATSMNRIARWDGSTWRSLGAGTNNTIGKLIVYGGQLIAGGTFDLPVRAIAAWNGASWSSLGRGLPITGVSAVVDDMIECNGRLAVSGLFPNPSSGVLLWDGSVWTSIGFANSTGWPRPGVLGVIDGQLISSGTLDINATTVRGVTSAWDGTSWTNWVGNADDFVPSARCATFRGMPVALGRRDRDNRYTLLIRSTTAWSPITPPAPTVPDSPMVSTTLGVIDYSISGESYHERVQFRCWDGVSWRPFGREVPGISARVCEFRSVIYAFLGALTPSGSLTARFFRWTGADWDEITDPIANVPAKLPYGIFVWNGLLIATNGIMPRDNPGMWDGTRWVEMPPTGLFGVYCGAVSNGDLFLGGFSTSTITGSVVRWNGTRWERTGPGIGNSVYSMCEYQGHLVAGGSFKPNDPVTPSHMGISIYDGTAWQPLGAGLGAIAGGNLGVLSVVSYHGRLIAAGDFWSSGAATVEGIAEWDGSGWQPFGGGVHADGLRVGKVNSLAEFRGELLAKGIFNSAGPVVSENFARFSDSMTPFISRQPMPQRLYVGEDILLGATPATGYAITDVFWTRNGERLVDGPTPAGSLISGSSSTSLLVQNATTSDSGDYRLTARSACGDATSIPAPVQVLTCDCPADFDRSGGIPDGADIEAFFAAWLLGDAIADTDCSGNSPDLTDIETFFSAWLNGGC